MKILHHSYYTNLLEQIYLSLYRRLFYKGEVEFIIYKQFLKLIIMRGESLGDRRNEHSITKKSHIFSKHSIEDSVSQGSISKKMSLSSVKQYINIDQLIEDIKIVPQNDNNIQEQINIINKSLTVLKQYTSINDQIRTIELLIESISKKLACDTMKQTRLKQSVKHSHSNHKESQTKLNTISPIKQFDEGSRIVYTNFSLKDMNNLQINTDLQTPIKRPPVYNQQNEEMERLNHEITMLEKMLKLKGVGVEPNKQQISVSSANVNRSKGVNQSMNKQKPTNKQNQNGKKPSLIEKIPQVNAARNRQALHTRGNISKYYLDNN